MKNDLIFFACLATFLVVVKMVDKWVVARSKKKVVDSPSKWENLPLDVTEKFYSEN